jgi:hypothetical protein
VDEADGLIDLVRRQSPETGADFEILFRIWRAENAMLAGRDFKDDATEAGRLCLDAPDAFRMFLDRLRFHGRSEELMATLHAATTAFDECGECEGCDECSPEDLEADDDEAAMPLNTRSSVVDEEEEDEDDDWDDEDEEDGEAGEDWDDEDDDEFEDDDDEEAAFRGELEGLFFMTLVDEASARRPDISVEEVLGIPAEAGNAQLTEILERRTGRRSGGFSRADFSRDRAAEDATVSLFNLTLDFSQHLAEQCGFSRARADLGRDVLSDHIGGRLGAARRAAEPLLPEPRSARKLVEDLAGAWEGRAHAAAAFVLVLPRWIDFLVARDLVDAGPAAVAKRKILLAMEDVADIFDDVCFDPDALRELREFVAANRPATSSRNVPKTGRRSGSPRRKA